MSPTPIPSTSPDLSPSPQPSSSPDVSPSPSPRLSTDYMGLEDGAILIYNYSLAGTRYPHGARGTMPMTVEEYQPGIFKVGYDLFGDIDGHYIEKEGNSYYIRGDWETDEDPPGEREELLCINPLTTDFQNNRWGSFEKKRNNYCTRRNL